MYTDRYRNAYAGGMTELEKGPQGRRRGRGARERILSASRQLFRDQGINRTGMDQLCAVAQVSKRTAYQHFADKDELVAEYLRRFDPGIMAAVFDRSDLTPRERLLAAFEVPASGTQDITPMCPYIAASVELHDPQHPASRYARNYNSRVARGETPSGYPAPDGQVQPGTARRAAQRRILHRGPRQAGTRHRHSPSVAVRETADGYTNRPTGMKPVRYASVAPRTQRHPPVQGGTPRHTDETAR